MSTGAYAALGVGGTVAAAAGVTPGRGPGLAAYLVVGALLFGIGVAGVLSQRGAIMIMMSSEIILNSAVLTTVAFWRFVAPSAFDGQVFVIVLVTVGAVELAAGLGLILLVYRQRGTQNVDRLSEMRG